MYIMVLSSMICKLTLKVFLKESQIFLNNEAIYLVNTYVVFIIYQAWFKCFTYINSLIPTINLWGRYYDYLHFIDEEIEAKRI